VGYFPRLEEASSQLAGDPLRRRERLAIGRLVSKGARGRLIIGRSVAVLLASSPRPSSRFVDQITEDGTTVVSSEQEMGCCPKPTRRWVMQTGQDKGSKDAAKSSSRDGWNYGQPYIG